MRRHNQYIIFPELMGSDQLFPLDGRWGYERIVLETRRKAFQLRRLGKTITKADICCGPIRSLMVWRSFLIPGNDLYLPGCGQLTHVAGTNGGWMPCGGMLTQLDGNKAPYFCAMCKS